MFLTSIIQHKRKPNPPKTERNKLIVYLRDSGHTLKEISHNPDVIKLSDNVILTLSRVAQIYRTTKKGGDKDGS